MDKKLKTKHKPIRVIDLFCGCGGLSEGLMQVGSNKKLHELLPPKICKNEEFLQEYYPKISEKAFDILAHVEWELPMVRTLRANLKIRWNENENEAKKRVFHFDIMESKALIEGCNRVDHGEELKTKFSNNDIQTLEGGLDALLGISGATQKKREGAVDLIVGGPPCQAFSMAGRAQDKDSMKHDYRNYLFENFAYVVNTYKPKMFIFENVEGLLSACPGGIPAKERIYEHFKSIGYLIYEPKDLKKALFNLADFGVPQSRKRLIIIGVKIEDNKYNLGSFSQAIKKAQMRLDRIYKQLASVCHYGEKSNQPYLLKHNTFSDATKHLEGELLEPIKGKSVEEINENAPFYLKHHIRRFHNKDDLRLFRKWLTNKMDAKPSKDRLDFYNRERNKQSKHIKYRSLKPDKPAPTIVAHLHKDGLMFIHPNENDPRSITVREAALLQSFPPDYRFPESASMCYKMIGNAVPPLFAKHLGEVIYQEFFNEEEV